ncbi:MAG: hypothetical protein WCE64_10435 [Bacteroidales bacterium]
MLAPLNQVPPKSGTRWRANMYRIDHGSGQMSYAWQKVQGTFHEYRRIGMFVVE